jgi:hypothetical protein
MRKWVAKKYKEDWIQEVMEEIRVCKYGENPCCNEKGPLLRYRLLQEDGAHKDARV